MLSGYLYKPRPFKEELKKVTKSLIVPYLIYNALLLIITPPPSLQSAVYVLLGNQEHLPDNYRPMWFLVALAMMRIISSLSKDKMVWAAFASLVVYIILHFFNALLHEWDLFQICTTLLCYHFFVFGYLFRQNKIVDIFGKLQKWKQIVLSGILFATFMILGYFNSVKSGGHLNVFNCETGYNVFAFLVVAYAMSYAVIKFFVCCFDKKNNVIITVSQGTLLILCLHQTMLDLLSRYMDINIVYIPFVMSIIVLAVSYFMIVVARKYCPILLGK